MGENAAMGHSNRVLQGLEINIKSFAFNRYIIPKRGKSAVPDSRIEAPELQRVA